MVIIIKKLILLACFTMPLSVFAGTASVLTPLPTKDSFNCRTSCTKRTCSSQLTIATACVSWCAPEDYEGCWQGAMDTINFQTKLTQNNIDSSVMNSESFLKRYARLLPTTKSNLSMLFQKALMMAQQKNKTEPIAHELTETTAKLRLSAGPVALNELNAIHHEEQKELRSVWTRVP